MLVNHDDDRDMADATKTGRARQLRALLAIHGDLDTTLDIDGDIDADPVDDLNLASDVAGDEAARGAEPDDIPSGDGRWSRGRRVAAA